MWKYPDSLKSAFPSALAEEVCTILRDTTVNEDYDHAPYIPFSVKVRGEIIVIPQRIYLSQNVRGIDSLSHLQKDIIYCYFTRNHNGFVRERYLRTIILSNKSWVMPYVIRLIGEYVIEILQVIYENIESMDMGLYREFVQENPEFYEKTKKQVVSYWSCYYRNRYKQRNSYVGFKIIEKIEN